MTTNLKNTSSLTVDFNKEFAGFMTATDNANGRELKLAVAIYSMPETFNIATLLGGNGSKKRLDGIRKALIAHSEAVKVKSDKVTDLKKVAKADSARGYAARAEYQAATRVLTAAVTMFERALVDAYFFHSAGALIRKVDAKSVTLQFTRMLTIGDVTFDQGATDTMSRKSINDVGMKLARARGILGTPVAAKAGTGVDTKAGTATATNAGELAKVIGALSQTAADEFTSSLASDALLAATIRRKFVVDGKFSVIEFIEALRKNEGFNGVTIETGEVRAVRRERKSATPIAA